MFISDRLDYSTLKIHYANTYTYPWFEKKTNKKGIWGSFQGTFSDPEPNDYIIFKLNGLISESQSWISLAIEKVRAVIWERNLHNFNRRDLVWERDVAYQKHELDFQKKEKKREHGLEDYMRQTRFSRFQLHAKSWSRTKTYTYRSSKNDL